MLKRNRNWRNKIGFFVTVLQLVKFQLGVGPLAPTPLATLMLQVRKTKRCSQIFREVSGVFQQNFNCSKNSAVLEPRIGQFWRTWGFEAKAKIKDLTFEAKAKVKDFKMCPRGLPSGRDSLLIKLRRSWRKTLLRAVNFFQAYCLTLLKIWSKNTRQKNSATKIEKKLKPCHCCNCHWFVALESNDLFCLFDVYTTNLTTLLQRATN